MWPFRKDQWYSEPGRRPITHLPAWLGSDVIAVVWINSDGLGSQYMRFSIRKMRKPTPENKRNYTCTFSPRDIIAVALCAGKVRRWYRKMKKAGVVR